MCTETEIIPKRDEDGYALVGAALEVHRELGSGFLESVYQEALEQVLLEQNISFQSQVDISVCFRGRNLNSHFRADLLVANRILVELKAVSELRSEHEAQLLNYLKATGIHVGYLLNFGGGAKLDWRRRLL